MGNTVPMFRSYELRLSPTEVQKSELNSLLRISCDLYNAAIQERTEAWQKQKKNIRLYDQNKELTELRQNDPEYAEISLKIMRAPLYRVNRAFQGFFGRAQRGENPGYLRYKSHERYSSISWDSAVRHGNKLTVPKLGKIKFKASQEMKGNPKFTTIIKKSEKKWIARIVCDIGPAPEKVAVSNAIGIDLGLTSLVTLSDGTSIENPRWTKKHEDRIADAGRKLSRKKRGSKNRLRARQALARAHERARDARDNYLHHVSKQLVSQYDLIAYEKLNVAGMVKYGYLGKYINDAAWAKLIWQISYKAEEAGRYAIAVNPKNTSQLCSRCGEKVPKDLSVRQHDCPHCGLSLNRDHNAAINVLRLGKSLADASPQNIYKISTEVK